MCACIKFWPYKRLWQEAPHLRQLCLNDLMVSSDALLSLPQNYRHWLSTSTSPSKIMLKHRIKKFGTTVKSFHNSWTQCLETLYFLLILWKLWSIYGPLESKRLSILLHTFHASPNQRTTWVGRDLKCRPVSTSLLWAGLQPTRSGYPGPHPTWSWHPIRVVKVMVSGSLNLVPCFHPLVCWQKFIFVTLSCEK